MNKPHNKKATVQDVAEIANVSVATVSRTLSKPQKVSEQTRILVMDAIRATGYTVNEAARSLRRQQTDTIMVLVPGIGKPIFANVLAGIEAVFSANKINVLIVNTEHLLISLATAPSYFNQNKADGIIILDGDVPLDILGLNPASMPIIFSGEWQEGTDTPIVCIDDEFGSRMIAEHLYNLGHRKLGQITGELDISPGRTRRNSFLEALTKLGSQANDVWEFNGRFTLATGKKAATAWLNLPENHRPTGVFCGCDDIAFSFMSTLRKAGINIPEDVSIVGYDDWEVSEYFFPALTTVHQPRKELGIKSAKTLLSLMQGNEIDEPEPIQPWLVTRESTCPPPA
jgi:LacI family repressor for deo operon, udp, cdd, tsx, nupC, and nupG